MVSISHIILSCDFIWIFFKQKLDKTDMTTNIFHLALFNRHSLSISYIYLMTITESHNVNQHNSSKKKPRIHIDLKSMV